MGLFNKSSDTITKPYRLDVQNVSYGLLFCGDIDLYRSETKASGYPWNILFAKNPEVNKLKVVSGPNTIDSRHRLLACNILLSMGARIDKKEPLGVIIELGVPEGLDVLAAYTDGSARHINHTGKITTFDTKTDASDKFIRQLFRDCLPVIQQIEPLGNERGPFPKNGRIKLTFLVSDGMYFWEGPYDLMQKDTLAGPVITSAINLLTHLTKK